MRLNLPSPVEPFIFRGKTFYVKRDDLIHPLISGNKPRKLHFLLERQTHEFEAVYSYGGVQSNAMVAIACICHEKGWKFEYICKTLPDSVRQTPDGNLKTALEYGMHLHEVSHAEYQNTIASLKQLETQPARLVISQGGAEHEAAEGIAVLADEVRLWQQEHGFDKISVVTPSGTGTTAYFLAKALPGNSVYTTPSVGDCTYLLNQMRMLGDIPPNLNILYDGHKRAFGKLKQEYLDWFDELKDSGIEFDLLYAPLMWQMAIEHYDDMEGPVLYIHSGGVSGNGSMLTRYRHKGWL